MRCFVSWHPTRQASNYTYCCMLYLSTLVCHLPTLTIVSTYYHIPSVPDNCRNHIPNGAVVTSIVKRPTIQHVPSLPLKHQPPDSCKIDIETFQWTSLLNTSHDLFYLLKSAITNMLLMFEQVQYHPFSFPILSLHILLLSSISL